MKYEDCLAYLRREEEWKRRQARWGFLNNIFQKKKIFANTWHKGYLSTFKIPKQTLDSKEIHHESTKYMKNIPRKVEQGILGTIEDKVRLQSLSLLFIIIIIINIDERNKTYETLAW